MGRDGNFLANEGSIVPCWVWTAENIYWAEENRGPLEFGGLDRSISSIMAIDGAAESESVLSRWLHLDFVLTSVMSESSHLSCWLHPDFVSTSFVPDLVVAMDCVYQGSKSVGADVEQLLEIS